MTNNNHPITPPDDLQEQWKQEWLRVRPAMTPFIQWMLAKSARWGADQELEACCEWLKSEGHEYEHEALFAARRPKPPSLKEEALALLQVVEASDDAAISWNFDVIRRALNSLPD